MNLRKSILLVVSLGMITALVACSSSSNSNSSSGSGSGSGTSSNGLAAGNYVFSSTGTDNDAYFYTMAGVIQVSSSGAITGGELDFSDTDPYTVLGEQLPATGGSVSVSADGNGVITIALPSSETYINGGNPLTLNFSSVSASQALLSEQDTWASGSGELDLQTSSSVPCPSASSSAPCGFAFFIGGWDSNGGPASIGGVIAVDGASGGIDGNGSVFDMNDVGSGTTYSAESISTGSSVAAADALGLGHISFTLNNSAFTSLILDGYVIDANHIRLVENPSDGFAGTTGGMAIGQTGTGTFSQNSVSGSSYVFGTTGIDVYNYYQVAGALSFVSDGSVTGNISYNDLTNISAQGGSNLIAESSSALCSGGSAATACYTVDPSGTGRVTITNVTDGNANYTLQAYLTGDSNGDVLIISMDGIDVLAGRAFAQSSGLTTASLSGKYSLNVTQIESDDDEQDGVGTVSSDGVSALTGFLDMNEDWLTPTPDVTFTGGYAIGSSPNGVGTGTITVSGNTASFTYYVVSPNGALAFESDDNQLTLGTLLLQ